MLRDGRFARLLSALLVASGCGSQQPGSGRFGADGEANLGDAGTGGAGGDAAPDREPVGIQQRPPNPSCLAPPRAVEAGLEGLPASLGQTGCFDPGDPRLPLPALIPYAVNVPLWSDGADKDRWLALPDGAQIQVTEDGDWDLPPGAVLIKTFRLAGRRIETRFFVRHPDGAWSGYTYEWNDAGTDGRLLDEGSHRKRVGDRDWHFPSRAECNNCHTSEAGHSLGLETAQLDRFFDYPGGVRAHQLATLVHLGLFAAAPAGEGRRAALPEPGDAGAALEARARGYLHANCSNCHRPGVGNSGSLDLRFATAFAATRSCDAEPLKGSLGYGPHMRIIAPGRPEDSMVVVRMRLLGSGRMPTIASLRVDEAGVALLSAWISSLPGCP
jgi:uncharacterized repeat protein (TIGR03806 family)